MHWKGDKGRELTFPESFLYKEGIAQWIKAEAQSQTVCFKSHLCHSWVHSYSVLCISWSSTLQSMVSAHYRLAIWAGPFLTCPCSLLLQIFAVLLCLSDSSNSSHLSPSCLPLFFLSISLYLGSTTWPLQTSIGATTLPPHHELPPCAQL